MPVKERWMTGHEISIRPQSNACEFDNPTYDI